MCDKANSIKNAAPKCSDGVSRRLSRFRTEDRDGATWRIGEMLGLVPSTCWAGGAIVGGWRASEAARGGVF